MIEKVDPEPEPITNGFSVDTKDPHRSVWDNEMDTKTADERRKA